tara:strand:- start:151 stop:438 length:288 start_codon:yes stop_codon:yes gene_type:complete
MRTKFGPKTRKELANEAIMRLFNEGYFEEWRIAREISEEISKNIPKYWGKFRPEAVRFALLRNKLPLETRSKDQRLQWRANEGNEGVGSNTDDPK